MGRISVGDLIWGIRGDSTKLPGDIEKAVKKSKKQMERHGRSFKSAGKNLTASLSLPILGLGAASAKMAADFNTSMAEVNSLIGLGGKDFKHLRDEIRGVSSELGLGLQDAAAASYQAISAGIPREELVGFLKVAGSAAVAGVSDLETSVGLLTKTMDAYGAESVSMQVLSDQLFATVKGGVTNFDELAAALPNATGLAAALGVESKELLGILARTTKVSESTSGAVTRIGSAMGALIKPSKDMEDLLEKAGIQNVKTAVETDGLTATLQRLRKAADGNDTVMAKAFGRKEAILLLQDLALNSEAWAEQLDSVANSAGAMSSAFSIIDEGPGRSMEKLKAAGSSLAVVIGDVLLPSLLPLVTGLTGLVQRLEGVDPAFIQMGVVAAGAAAALGPVLIGVGTLMTGLAGLMPILSGTALAGGGIAGAFTAISAAMGPVGWTIAALVAGGALLIANWETVKAAAVGFVSVVSANFAQWKAANSETFASIGASLSSLGQSFSVIFGAIGGWISGAIGWLNQFLAPIGGLRGAWDLLFASISAGWNSVMAVLGTALEIVSNNFAALADVLTGQKTLWQAFKDTVSANLSAVKELVGTIISNHIIQPFSRLGGTLQKLGGNMVQGLLNGMKAKGQEVVSFAKGIADKVKNAFTVPWKVRSPAKLFIAIGKFAMDGLRIGLEKSAGAVAAAKSAAGQISGALSGGIAGVALGAGVASASPLGGLAGQSDFSQTGFGSVASQYIPEVDKIAAKFAAERETILGETKITEDQRTALLIASDQTRAAQLQGNQRDLLGSLASMQAGHNEGMLAASRAASLAQAVIQRKGALFEAAMNTKAMAIGAYKALAPIPFVGPILGAAAAATALAYGASQMAGIGGPPSFEGGGFTGGGSRSGGVDGRGGFNAILHPNEIVTDLNQVSPSSSPGAKSVTVEMHFHDANPQRLAEIAGEIGARAKQAVFEAMSEQGEERRIVGSI